MKEWLAYLLICTVTNYSKSVSQSFLNLVMFAQYYLSELLLFITNSFWALNLCGMLVSIPSCLMALEWLVWCDQPFLTWIPWSHSLGVPMCPGCLWLADIRYKFQAHFSILLMSLLSSHLCCLDVLSSFRPTITEF